MSGFVGIVHADEKPIDARLIGRMTQALRFRGPDGQQTLIDGAVGFGCTTLHAGGGARASLQPLTVDGQVWITGDLGLTARPELIEMIDRKRGPRPPADASDAELILRAYDIWGTDCVQHLLGDFSFAIWDRSRRQLFCARDHLGIKPFYYARIGAAFVFSNTLECLRMHPAVSSSLNDAAIGDFLLFGFNRDVGTTAFRDLRRLAPAHRLTWSAATTRIERYWSLPQSGSIQYRRPSEYVEHFSEVFRAAVEDRLTTGRGALLMSGGIDSASVAAAAAACSRSRQNSLSLRAFSVVYDRVIPDDERRYAGLVANALNVPISFFPADDYARFDGADRATHRTPEPVDDPMPALTIELFRRMSEYGRVGLSGEGGDAALCPSASSNCLSLMGRGKIGLMLAMAARCLGRGARPPLGVRPALRRLLRRDPWRAPYPSWLRSDFAERFDLRGRWEDQTRETPSDHPDRPEAHSELASPFWPYLFETYDAGLTRAPITVRHPFFDVRVLQYLLAVPVVPWCIDKQIVRDAIRGHIPEQVRRRKKTPLAVSPVSAWVASGQTGWHTRVAPGSQLVNYVDARKLPRTDCHLVTRPWCLDRWLRFESSSPVGLG